MNRMTAFQKGLTVALILLCSIMIQAKEKKPMGKLETNIRLNGANIVGKGLKPMTLDTLAEDDKYLNDLLGVRKNFDDKSTKDQSRRLK